MWQIFRYRWEYVWVEFDGLRTTEILNVCGFGDAPVCNLGRHEKDGG